MIGDSFTGFFSHRGDCLNAYLYNKLGTKLNKLPLVYNFLPLATVPTNISEGEEGIILSENAFEFNCELSLRFVADGVDHAIDAKGWENVFSRKSKQNGEAESEKGDKGKKKKKEAKEETKENRLSLKKKSKAKKEEEKEKEKEKEKGKEKEKEKPKAKRKSGSHIAGRQMGGDVKVQRSRKSTDPSEPLSVDGDGGGGVGGSKQDELGGSAGKIKARQSVKKGAPASGDGEGGDVKRKKKPRSRKGTSEAQVDKSDVPVEITVTTTATTTTSDSDSAPSSAASSTSSLVTPIAIPTTLTPTITTPTTAMMPPPTTTSTTTPTSPLSASTEWKGVGPSGIRPTGKVGRPVIGRATTGTFYLSQRRTFGNLSARQHKQQDAAAAGDSASASPSSPSDSKTPRNIFKAKRSNTLQRDDSQTQQPPQNLVVGQYILIKRGTQGGSGDWVLDLHPQDGDNLKAFMKLWPSSDEKHGGDGKQKSVRGVIFDSKVVFFDKRGRACEWNLDPFVLDALAFEDAYSQGGIKPSEDGKK